jgi:hypothetical protein
MLGFKAMAVKTILEGIIFTYQFDCHSTFHIEGTSNSRQCNRSDGRVWRVYHLGSAMASAELELSAALVQTSP